MQFTDTDCVVIGAGLVGCVAALGLSRNGFRVQIFETVKFCKAMPEDGRSLVLSRASIQILKALQIWPNLSQWAYSVKNIRVSEKGTYGSVLLSAEEVGAQELGCSFPAGKLLGALRNAVVEDPKILVRDQASFSELKEHNDYCEVSIVEDGSTDKVTTRFLIGADGSGSTVRTALGASLSSISYGQHAVVAELTASVPCNHKAYEHFTGQGPLAFIPTGLNTYTSVQCFDVEASVHARAMSDDAYLRLTEKNIGGRLGVMSNLGKRYSYPLMRQRSSLLNSKRTVVIGNAANVVHPNGAQGLNLGFRDVASLLTLMKRSGKICDTKATLELYASLRLKDHRMTGRFTDLMAQGSRSSLNTLVVLRRLSMLAFSHSSRLRKRLVQKASGLGLLEQSVDFSLWDK